MDDRHPVLKPGRIYPRPAAAEGRAGLQRCLRTMGTLCVLAVLGLLLLCAPSLALDVPPLKGRVNDYAGLVSPATARLLEVTLKRFEEAESTQIVVLTVPTLAGDSLEDFSIRVAEQWRIGQKGVDNGAILVVAKAERKLRIEVGYGLEGRLTDAVAGRIIREVIVPEFRAGRFEQGIINGVNAIVQVVQGEFEGAQPRREAPAAGPGAGSAVFFLVVLFMLIGRLSRISRGMGILAGGVLAPIFGALSLSIGWPYFLFLIPAGLFFGYIISTLFYA
ncbi:MAG: TPM domain-containing protein, partial [Desulfobacterales bacterium]